MLSSVLNSERAIQMSLLVVNAFVRMPSAPFQDSKAIGTFQRDGDFPLKWFHWTAFHGVRPSATGRRMSFLRLHCRSHHYRGRI